MTVPNREAARPGRRKPAAAGPAVDVVVESAKWPDRTVLKALAERAVTAAARRNGGHFAPGAEMAVIYSDDARIRGLNLRHRGHDRPTNVLSFPVAPPGARQPQVLLGDVILAFETVSREAAERGVDLGEHATHLIVHGFLHLLGRDHETDDEAVVMEAMETAIMQDLGFSDPYGPEEGDKRR